MSNTYTTRVNFTIACNDDLDITLSGMWYRYESTKYVVTPDKGVSEWFDKLPDALECFERLTATPTKIDVTPEEDEAFQALSTAPVSSF